MTHVDTQTPTLGLSAWPGTLSHWTRRGLGLPFSRPAGSYLKCSPGERDWPGAVQGRRPALLRATPSLTCVPWVQGPVKGPRLSPYRRSLLRRAHLWPGLTLPFFPTSLFSMNLSLRR